MKQVSTLFLKIVIGVLAIPAVVFLGWSMWMMLSSPVATPYEWVLYPLVIGLEITVLPYLFGLYHAFLLLKQIDAGEAFTRVSLRSLRWIRMAAVSICGVYVGMLPFFFRLADLDDAPGVLALGLVVFFAASVIAVFAMVLEKLLKQALYYKDENELTV